MIYGNVNFQKHKNGQELTDSEYAFTAAPRKASGESGLIRRLVVAESDLADNQTRS
jgi:hypothetical protein